MKRRIFKAMLALSLGMAALFVAASLLIIYLTFSGEYKERLESELKYVAAAMQATDDPAAYLEEVRSLDARLTWVGADGAVRFDSGKNPKLMDSHLDRPEIAQALIGGEGRSERWSATLGETTFYSARLLPDGSVLRAAITRTSLFSILLSLMGLLVFLCLVISSLSIWAADRVTSAIVRPINHLDLVHPLDNEVYEELTPLLAQLERQNRKIDMQMREQMQRQTQFTAITDHMSEGLVVLDPDMGILSINKSAARLFGVGEGERTGGHILGLCRDMALIRALNRAGESGQSAGETMALGGRFYQLLVSPVVSDDQTDGMVLLILDVTDGMLAEKSRREFSANVSHELKTPLTAILGYAEIMQGGMVPLDDMRGFAGRIHAEAARLIQLIEDIIRLSRLDEGAPGAVEESVELLELCGRVARRLNERAAREGIKLSAEGDVLWVRGEPAMLEEMVYNLADNAIKYGRPGGWAAMRISGRTLSVSDDGIGIAPEDQARVFERFYRVDKSRSREVGGTGLGLSIVKHAAQRLGAQIALESAPGRGTRVDITFP